MNALITLGALFVSPISGPRLVDFTESRTNGVLTALGFEWDMGDRLVREVPLGATAQVDGLAEPLTRTTLRRHPSSRCRFHEARWEVGSPPMDRPPREDVSHADGTFR